MRYIFGGKNYYIAIFPGENLLYSNFPHIQVRGKGEIWLWGNIGSMTPALYVHSKRHII